MEENNEVRAILVDMRVSVTKTEMDGWRPKGHAGTADHPGG